MNKYITTLRATALAALLVPALAACTDQADGTDPASTGLLPLHLTTTIDGGIAATSRAASVSPAINGLKSQFNADDRISLTYTNDHIKALSTTPDDGTQTVDAIYGTNGQWTFDAGTTVYLDYPSPEPVTGFYPNVQQLTDGGLDAAGVRLVVPPAETPGTPLLECVDALQGSVKPTLQPGGTQAEAAITLSHLHQLLNIGIDARTIDGAPTVNIAQVMLKVSYTPADGSGATDYLVGATSSPAPDVAEDDHRHFYHAIVPATAAPEVIDITRGDVTPLPPTGEGTYTLNGAAITVQGGRVYHLTFNGGKVMKANYRLTLNVALRGDVLDFDFTNNGLGWNPGTAPDHKDYDIVISTAEELHNFADKVSKGRYITYLDGTWSPAIQARVLQTADIDLKEYTDWTPIGSSSYPFIGAYNGNGFKIKNLKMANTTGTATVSGLFGYIGNAGYTAVLAGIRLEGVTINATQGEAGALVGNVTNSCVSLCSATDVTFTGGAPIIGGLVGTANKGSIVRCSASLKSVELTTAQTACIGGLVGKTQNYTMVASCSTSGELKITASAELHAGGLIGHIEGTEVGSSLSAVTLTLSGAGTAHAGGLVGDVSKGSTVSGCYTTGSFTSGTKAGALAGMVAADCTFTYCYGKYSEGSSEIASGATTSNIIYKNGGEPNLDNSNNPPTAYTDEVYQIVKSGARISGYSTAYDGQKYPAYATESNPVYWKCADAWNSGNGYPSIKMTYEGDPNN